MATAFDVEGHLEWIVSKDQEDDFSISLKLPSLLAELSARIFQTLFYCQFILDIVLRMTRNAINSILVHGHIIFNVPQNH